MALKSGRAQGIWGTEVPQRGPGAEPRWGSGGEEARYIQTVCSCQMLFSTQVLLPVRPPSSLPSPPQKKLPICANPMTQHGGQGGCPPVASLLAVSVNSSWVAVIQTMKTRGHLTSRKTLPPKWPDCVSGGALNSTHSLAAAAVIQIANCSGPCTASN